MPFTELTPVYQLLSWTGGPKLDTVKHAEPRWLIICPSLLVLLLTHSRTARLLHLQVPLLSQSVCWSVRPPGVRAAPRQAGPAVSLPGAPSNVHNLAFAPTGFCEVPVSPFLHFSIFVMLSASMKDKNSVISFKSWTKTLKTTSQHTILHTPVSWQSRIR